MNDESISERIERLVRQEHELRNREESDAARHSRRTQSACVPSRSSSTCVGTCCASDGRLRDAGVNPDQAAARDPNTVERYWQ